VQNPKLTRAILSQTMAHDKRETNGIKTSVFVWFTNARSLLSYSPHFT